MLYPLSLPSATLTKRPMRPFSPRDGHSQQPRKGNSAVIWSELLTKPPKPPVVRLPQRPFARGGNLRPLKTPRKNRLSKNVMASLGLCQKLQLQEEMESVMGYEDGDAVPPHGNNGSSSSSSSNISGSSSSGGSGSSSSSSSSGDSGSSTGAVGGDIGWTPTVRGVLPLTTAKEAKKELLLPMHDSFVSTYVVVGAVQHEFKFQYGVREFNGTEDSLSQQNLCKFPRIKGSRVTEGLFDKTYHEPNGSHTYYYRSGGAYERASIMHNPPPSEPLTYADIWMDGLPDTPRSPAITLAGLPTFRRNLERPAAPYTAEKLPMKDRPIMYVGFIGIDWPEQGVERVPPPLPPAKF